MDLNSLFSFQGRIRRSQFWLTALGVGIGAGIIVGIIFMVLMGGGRRSGPIPMLGGLLCLAVYAVAIWIGLANAVKRWHDRDKAWYWIFIGAIPIIGPIWALVECGFLDGTPGPNRFGPSPKGIAGPAPMQGVA